jgi:hypothetical protein
MNSIERNGLEQFVKKKRMNGIKEISKRKTEKK